MTIIRDMPAEDYFANPAFGSTSIRYLSDPEISLQEVKYLLEHDEHKKEYDIGTLAHALILEGSLDHLVVEVPFDTYHSKDAKAMRDAAYAAGLVPLKTPEFESTLGPVEAMRDAVMAHPIAADLLTDHEPEVSLFWEQGGVKMKARIDALHEREGIAVDLKTVRSARPNDFRKQISDLGYYIQAKHYLNGLKQVTGKDYEWYFVAAGKTDPYVVSVHRIADVALDEAQTRIEHAIDRYKQALERGWAGYGEIFTQDLTTWESIKNEDLYDTIMEIKI